MVGPSVPLGVQKARPERLIGRRRSGSEYPGGCNEFELERFIGKAGHGPHALRSERIEDRGVPSDTNGKAQRIVSRCKGPGSSRPGDYNGSTTKCPLAVGGRTGVTTQARRPNALTGGRKTDRRDHKGPTTKRLFGVGGGRTGVTTKARPPNALWAGGGRTGVTTQARRPNALAGGRKTDRRDHKGPTTKRSFGHAEDGSE
jgi:hypothetical protein